MMLYPSIGTLMEKAGNRYALVIAASKRARQMEKAKTSENREAANDGAKSISAAIIEIADDTVKIKSAASAAAQKPKAAFVEPSEIPEETEKAENAEDDG
jgi:DNA-directed RNA polymerase omega subunit